MPDTPQNAAQPSGSTQPGTPLPRPEHPRPSVRHADWVNLNGSWEFEVDAGDSGLERRLRERPLAGSITVPFAPDSELSGIGDPDFVPAV